MTPSTKGDNKRKIRMTENNIEQMAGMIARQVGSAQRIFPTITMKLYSDFSGIFLTPNQKAARKILSLVNRKFSRWERLTGRGLDILGQISRMLQQHWMALEAEQKGQWQRANFFWQESHRSLKKLYPRSDVWRDLVNNIADMTELTIMADPEQLRNTLATEIFLDTHCAFYNNRAQQIKELKPNDRAFVHIDFIRQFIEFIDISIDEQIMLLSLPTETQILACQKAGDWKRAITVCSDFLINHFPNLKNFQNKLAGLYVENTVAKLVNDESESSNLSDANKLRDGIQYVEKMRINYPYNIFIYESLGFLYHLRAIKLANGKHFYDALVNVQKALTYNPYMDEAKETFNQLIEIMKSLDSQMPALKIKLASGMTLNAESLHLLKETKKGFQPLEKFVQSSEAEEIAKAFYCAEGRNIWLDIGLPEPDENWDTQITALMKALNKVISEPPAKSSDIMTVWNEIASGDDSLSKLNATLICNFLKHRIFAEEYEEKNPTNQKTTDLSANVQIIKGAVSEASSKEPLGYWFFSGQDTWVKVQAIFAVLLLLLAGGFTVYELNNRQIRDSAYIQITEAIASENRLNIIKGSETFLATPFFAKQDARQQEVMEVYYNTMIQWFVEKIGKPTTDEQTHINRFVSFGKVSRDEFERQVKKLKNHKIRKNAYAQIIEAVDNHSYLDIIKGAEVFLSIPIEKDKSREDKVLELYHEAIVRWFIEHTNELNAEEQIHLERYRTLVTNR